MIEKLNESFDFDDIEQDESGINNSIHGIRVLGKIKDSIKKESSHFVEHQVSNTFEEFVDFVEKDLPYIIANKESLLDMLAPKSQTLNLCALIKGRSTKEYGIGTVGFKETIDKLFSTLKKAFNILGFSKWQNVGQKIKIKVRWNEMRIPYTGEDYTSANALRCGVVYSLYEMLLKNIEYVVNTFSFDLKSIIDGGAHQTYIGYFNLLSYYVDPSKDNIKKKLKDCYKNAFEDAFTPKDDPYTRITSKEFIHILKIGKDFVNSPVLFEAFDFTEDTPIEDIDSQIEHNKTLALYKSSSMHDAVINKFKELERKQGGYGLPLNVAISEETLWMADYIVQDAIDIFAEGNPGKFFDERGMIVFLRYCQGNNVRPFDFTPKVDKFVIDFDNAGKISNYLENLVETIKKYESKWIYDYEQYARFLNNIEIKGYDFSNLANLGYYLGFLMNGSLQLVVNGKKFHNFVVFDSIRDEETIEACLDRALWYQQILAEKFTKEELLKFTKDFIRGNKDRKNIRFGLNESFVFDMEADNTIDVGKSAIDSIEQPIIWTRLFFNLKTKDPELEIVPYLEWIFDTVYKIDFYLSKRDKYIILSYKYWKGEVSYLTYYINRLPSEVDSNSQKDVLNFFEDIYKHLMSFYVFHSDTDCPYQFEKEKTSAKLRELFDEEEDNVSEAFNFDDDNEDDLSDTIKKSKISSLVNTVYELLKKWKEYDGDELYHTVLFGTDVDIPIKYKFPELKILEVSIYRSEFRIKGRHYSLEICFSSDGRCWYRKMDHGGRPVNKKIYKEVPEEMFDLGIKKIEDCIVKIKKYLHIKD